MYLQICELLDEIGYAFNKHELKACTIRSRKNKILKALLEVAKGRTNGFVQDKDKLVLAAISAIPDIEEDEARDLLKSYLSSEEHTKDELKLNYFSRLVRNSEEFEILLILNGEAADRTYKSLDKTKSTGSVKDINERSTPRF